MEKGECPSKLVKKHLIPLSEDNSAVETFLKIFVNFRDNIRDSVTPDTLRSEALHYLDSKTASLSREYQKVFRSLFISILFNPEGKTRKTEIIKNAIRFIEKQEYNINQVLNINNAF